MLPRNYYLDDLFNNLLEKNDTSRMKCDIYEQEDNFFIEMDAPGFSKEDIQIEVKDGYLTIAASKKQEQEEKNYIRRERNYTSYERSFYLGNVKEEEITAAFKDGILIIKIPKNIEVENVKKIEIL